MDASPASRFALWESFMVLRCAERQSLTLPQAKQYVADASAGNTIGCVRCVVAALCERCKDWHVDVVERQLTFGQYRA